MPDKTLVLGGGGPVGGAWLTGMLAGLTEAGTDLDTADVLIGTSAGAVFGARLRCGTPAAELYERQLSGADAVRLPVTARQTARFLWAALGSRDPERSVTRLGRTALRARTGPESDVFDTVGGFSARHATGRSGSCASRPSTPGPGRWRRSTRAPG